MEKILIMIVAAALVAVFISLRRRIFRLEAEALEREQKLNEKYVNRLSLFGRKLEFSPDDQEDFWCDIIDEFSDCEEIVNAYPDELDTVCEMAIKKLTAKYFIVKKV